MRQEDLAKASGLKQSDISKIENGLILKTTGIVALARALRCDPEWLATGEGEMQSERTWPFVLLTPDQLHRLPAEHLATVEKVALDLLATLKVSAPRGHQDVENVPKPGQLKTLPFTMKRKKRSGTSDSTKGHLRSSGGGQRS